MPQIQPRFKCVAIVPAGGMGSRFGASVPKQYAPLAGSTVITHTLKALLAVSSIEQIFVVVAETDAYANETIEKNGRVTVLRCAGETRAATVLNALESLRKKIERDAWVLVHDAARPCVKSAMIEAMIESLNKHPVGGLMALPMSDTVKRADNKGQVRETVPRGDLWRAQTPQMFRFDTLSHALKASPDVTDEAEAIESIGLAPHLFMGDTQNIKITTPEDVLMAEFFIKRSL